VHVVSASADKSIGLWDIVTQQIKWAVAGHEGTITGCAFSPGGRYILSVSLDCSLSIWDVSCGGQEVLHREFSAPLTSCAYSPDGRTIMIGDCWGGVHFLDVQER